MEANLQLQVSDHYLLIQQIKREIQKMAATCGRKYLWTVEELEERFEIIAFRSPYCTVKDRLTGKIGLVELRKAAPWLLFDWPEMLLLTRI